MELRRDLGPIAATSVVVGSMIGSGIFFGPQIVAWQFTQHGIEPTGGLIIAVWAVAGFLVLLGALTFAELSASLPESGGQYVYLREAYGPGIGFLQGWQAFFIGKAASISALAVAFASLLSELEGSTVIATSLDVQLTAVALIVLLTGVNYVGVKFGGWVQSVTTFLKVGALVALAFAALAFEPSQQAVQQLEPVGDRRLFAAFGLALVPALWAYDGFYNSTQVAEEIKNPSKNLPLSLVGGTLLVMVVYILTNMGYVAALGGRGLAGIEDQLAGVEGQLAALSPAGLTADLVGGEWFAVAIIVGVLISIFGTCNGVIMTGPRFPFAMARDGVFFQSLVRVHESFATPWAALVLQGVWSIVLVFILGTFRQLIELVIFATWLFLALAGLAVILLRRQQPDLPRPYKVPLYPWVPIAFIVLSTVFTFTLIFEDPSGSLLGALIILAGLPVYWYIRWTNPMNQVDLEEIDR